MYVEKLNGLETDKRQLQDRLKEAERAVELADAHLKKEIEKIQLSLEQEYSRRYDRDHKQHQQELEKLRLQLTTSAIQLRGNSQQETEEIKKIRRAEIDRLYRE